MNNGHDKADEVDARAVSRRDAGVTFIELLVAIVLLGTIGVATMTALYVSIRGSDQHKSKVNAVAELEGAAAFLARVAWDSDCSTTPLDLNNDLSTDRPGMVTDNMSISVVGLSCVDGLPRAELVATSSRGDAVERLFVTLGGISVLKSEGAGGGGGPSCLWETLSANPPTGTNVHTNGTNAGKLKSSATISIRLTFTGPCSGPIPVTIAGQGSGPTFTRNLSQDPLDPLVLNVTLVDNEVYWRPDTYIVSVALPGVPDSSFVVG